MLTDDTIAALATAPGEAAIAVVRISGSKAEGILQRVFQPARKTENPSQFLPPRRMVLGTVRRGEEAIDPALAVFFPGPQSYTGEPVAEVHGHGGVLVSARVLEAVLEAGARMAEPGEFTRRAFLNGKMDLTQAEAVMDLIRARSPLALRAAREQLAGNLGREIHALRQSLLDLVANIEAWIDFPDEDIDPRTGSDFLKALDAAIDTTDTLLATAGSGRVFRHGIRTVLCGAPNAGKSSLLNRLLGFDRAIVTATPGTTRDTIEEPATFGGFPFLLTDTAGLRESVEEAELLGIDRARKAVEQADIVLRVIDACGPVPDGPGREAGEIRVFNKIDLVDGASVGFPRGLRVSCKTGEGLEGLVEALVSRARELAPSPGAAAINARHEACLTRCRSALLDARSELEMAHSPEFAASGLHAALDAVGEIVGLADTEEILGAIFSRFCIGK